MNDLDSTAPELVNEDMQVEVSNLDLPRSQRVAMPAWARRFMQHWQAPHARQRVRKISNAGLALIIVLVIALLSGNNFFSLLANQVRSGFGLFRPPVARPAPQDLLNASTPFAHVHGQDGIACLLDAQWSPHSDAIAVLGYEYNCPTSHDVPGILNIYDARTGKLNAQWQLDDTILTIMNAPTINTAGPDTSTHGVLATSSFQNANAGSANMGSTRLLPFSYIHVTWSPDEQRLALSFIVYMQQQPFFGILEMNTNGHFSRVIFQPPNLNQQTPIEWNLATGQALGFTPVPLAISYHWKADGSLIPFMPLSDDAQQPMSLAGPVGNPDGSAAFTIWQPGLTTFTSIAGYYAWSTSFSAWSPDGRYLIDNINLRGLYRPPATIIPGIQALTRLKLQHNRLLSPRKIATLELIDGSPLISWRPDGRVFSTYYTAQGYMIFYNSQTGRPLQTLQLSSHQRLLAGTLSLLRWSPDGSHLLLANPTNGLLNIWGPGLLPQLHV